MIKKQKQFSFDELKELPNDKLIEHAESGHEQCIGESLARFALALTALAKPQFITKVGEGIELVHAGVDVVKNIKRKERIRPKGKV